MSIAHLAPLVKTQNRDNLDFQKTCEFYYGDATFAEGYERTRKHVCISVSASTLGVKNPVRA